MSIYAYVRGLTDYGLSRGLIEKEDELYARNQILARLSLEEYEEPGADELFSFPEGEEVGETLCEILKGLCDYAAKNGLIPEDTVTQRDLFDTKLMNCLMPRPGEVCRVFREKYHASPKEASDYFYKLSKDSDYIRRYRVKKDLRWKTETEYGMLDITINLSKPEKDPKEIAALRTAKQSGYPKCLLCPENVGYAGRLNHPARDNHRIIPLCLNGEAWGFQYSPYVYYNEHCIVFCCGHTPMRITEATFRRLFDFVEQFPHYILGSNADLPIVGGSILTHDHFQGGSYEFPMAKAEIEAFYEVPEAYKGLKAGIVRWPLSVLRISGTDTEKLCAFAGEVLRAWRAYTDEAAFIFAETDGEAHNTITPIARCRDGVYEIDLVLRNNITTKEHPMGVYHPHAELHHIKKENIGLIEVMGLAVLPARLKQEMSQLRETVLKACGEAASPKAATEKAEALLRADEGLSKHADWAASWLSSLLSENAPTEECLEEKIREEIGRVFCRVLEDAGVYKCTGEGRAAFGRFLESLSMKAL